MIDARLADVSFSYGEREVVSRVDIHVPAGEMTGLVGPNGSGKSTLLGLLSGTLRPRGGEVMIDDKPLLSYGRKDLARLVAVVPQASPNVFPYSVAEIVAMGRNPYLPWGGWVGEEDRAACRRAMDVTSVGDFAGRTLQSLSAGERQRVFLARALAQSPRLLLLDEASSFLDIGQELALFRVIDSLRRDQGLTVLTVSHDLNLVGTFCQQVVLLKEGAVSRSGALTENYNSETLTALFNAEVTTSPRRGGGVSVSW